MKAAWAHIPGAPVKANVYLFTPSLTHIESPGAQRAATPLALDGQIPGEVQECGLDTTHEHSAAGPFKPPARWLTFSSLFLQWCILHQETENVSKLDCCKILNQVWI